jgi:hypothetical protein
MLPGKRMIRILAPDPRGEPAELVDELPAAHLGHVQVYKDEQRNFGPIRYLTRINPA